VCGQPESDTAVTWCSRKAAPRCWLAVQTLGACSKFKPLGFTGFGPLRTPVPSASAAKRCCRAIAARPARRTAPPYVHTHHPHAALVGVEHGEVVVGLGQFGVVLGERLQHVQGCIALALRVEDAAAQQTHLRVLG